MMPEFQSLPWLYFKTGILMGACAVAAMGFLDTRPRLPEGGSRDLAALCVSLPLGMAALILAGYLSLRLMVLAGAPRPFPASVAVGGAVLVLGNALFWWRWARRGLPRADGVGRRPRQATGALLVVLALAAVGMLPLLPLALSSDIVFYAGVGTDATGYVRTARSMMEGWYFDPAPHATMADVLYHTDRAWTYSMIAMKHRPLAFYLVALVATLCRLNPFQAYLAAEAMAVVLLAAFALFLVFAYARDPGLRRGVVALLALGLVLMAGLTGDLFRQFLGHAWSIVGGVVLAPALFWACLGGRRLSWTLPLCAFLVALFAIDVYDVRFALFSLGASLAAWALLPATSGRYRAAAVVVGIGAVVGASLVTGGGLRDLRSLRGFNENQFPDVKLALDEFLVQAGMERAPADWLRRVWIALSAAILLAQAVAFGKALRMGEVRPEPADEGFRFLSNGAFLLHLGSLVAVLALARSGNGWAAHKTLFWFAAAQAISGTLWLVSMANHRWNKAGVAAGLAVASCALVSVGTAWHSARAVVEQPAAYGVIARDGLLQAGSELERVRPDVVWFEGTVLEWVVFYSHFQEGRWATLAPYPLWYHGAGLFQRTRPRRPGPDGVAPGAPMDVALKRVYTAALQQPEVRQARTLVAVLGREASDAWPQARCGRPYCVVPISRDDLMSRGLQSVR